jgi:glycosyltransferase involved in cell wall biosynthesis
MKTAIVHEWIAEIGGSERCLESINRIFPSDVFTLVCKDEKARMLGIDPARVTTSFLQTFPQATKRYRSYLPFFPLAVEQFDVSGYDVVISSSHAVAKGVLVNADQLHLCYCYTPMRYAWDLYHQYLKASGLDRGMKGKIAKLVLHYLRLWDLGTAQRVDHFAAISHYIARRIKKIYGRDAAVIYPPVDVDRFDLGSKKEDYYLAASRMVPYKKMDLIVEAFSQMPDKRLVVIGDGPEFENVKSRAKRNVEFLGYQPFDVLRDAMQKAQAFLFAAEEDFGILPVEAQACGTPVIAYGKGGSLETVVPLRESGSQRADSDRPPTGVFFHEQTPTGLINAIELFEKSRDTFDGQQIRNHAITFSRERFEREFKAFVDAKMAEMAHGS